MQWARWQFHIRLSLEMYLSVLNFLNIISPVKVKEQLKNLNVNKSSGPDLVHPRILYELREELAYPLTKIFNLSIVNKTLPNDWKSANISAIYKKGKKNEVSNYRPISLTCIACKVMETLVRDKIMEYFVLNKLFTDKQFGFLKGRSTVTQLLHIMEQWTKLLETGGRIDVIYTDLEKAFDKVPHRRLISKLRSYGIDEQLVSWIEAFLIHRKQRVVVNGTTSEWEEVLSGIPQGSVLGPLLFIIYINDVVEACGDRVNVFLFADDAKIYNYIAHQQDEVMLQQTADNFIN